ncbi:MAG: Verru_Chthon cassette protein A [Chthoniobacteraceae bacterium]
MKTLLRFPHRGAALIFVLAMLVLLTAITVGFFARAVSLRKTTANERASVSARALADTTVNLVQAQIDHAATRGNGTVWASQPGAIRLFDQSGSLNTVYRLYSGTAMTSSSAAALASDAPPATWATQKALWVDLNAPATIKDASGATDIIRFPILDPRDPADSTQINPVEGFSVDTANTPGATKSQPAPMPVRWLYVLQNGQIVTPTTSGSGTVVTVAGASGTNPITGRIAFWTDDETCKVNINTASEGTYWDTPRLLSNQEQAYANYQPYQNEFQRYPGHPAMTSLAPILFATGSTATPALTDTQREALYAITPRIVGGGSKGGTYTPGTTNPSPLTSDTDRLYASVGEMIYTPTRGSQSITPALDPEKLERSRFFLTARSRAPETTLFGTPRVAMWPIANGVDATRTTAYDRLIARCATINGLGYYFQRSSAHSPTSDWADIERNRKVLRYLQNLTNTTEPGFDASLVSKTSTDDRDQLLVEMLDYVRSTNLYDDNLSPNTYSSQTAADSAVQFTNGRMASDTRNVYDGHGTVAPLRVPSGLGDTYPSETDTTSLMGFGRFTTISEAGLLFICCGDGKNGTFDTPRDDNGNTLTGTPSAEQLARMESNVPPGSSVANRTYGYQLNQSNSSSTNVNSTADTPPTTTVNAISTIYPVNNMLASNTKLATNERRIQMMLLFDYFSPMHGWTRYALDHSLDVEITGNFTVGGQTVSLASSAETVNFDSQKNGYTWGYQAYGGNMGCRMGFWVSGGTSRLAPLDGGSSDAHRRYGLVSAPFTISSSANTMSFTGPTKLLVKLYARQKDVGRATNRSASDLVQTIELKFPDASFPIPTLKTVGTKPSPDATAPATAMENWWSLSDAGAFSSLPSPTPTGYASLFGRFRNIGKAPGTSAGTFIRTSDTLRTLVPYHADFRLVAGSHYVPSGVFQPSTYYYDTTRNDTSTDSYTNELNSIKNFWALSGGTRPNQIETYITSDGASYYDASLGFCRPANANMLVQGANYNSYQLPKFPGFAPSSSSQLTPCAFQQWGDFDNGVAYTADGAHINKPDEGNNTRYSSTDNTSGIPYFTQPYEQVAGGATFFSPNRQVPGPGMFGSLPARLRTGNQAYSPSASSANAAWRTLLFRPQTGHPGAANPPDHLWMDLFWMPVVEPYAISEPFSTAGKINMNYAIAPFSYIRRATGIVALLRAEKMLVIPTANAATYKVSPGLGTTELRKSIDAHETLKQFDAKFAANDVFRCSTQICDLHLIPSGTTITLSGTTTNADSVMSAFWTTNALTGDNSRERPYTNIQGRLTTKSNTFTVYYTVQALKNPNSHAQDTWDESKGAILSEYRGATSIERYINPDDTLIPDYANDTSKISSDQLDRHYNWRIIENSQFAP